MRFMISEKNGCTYALDAIHGVVLMYHPLYVDGTYETNMGAYADVEWDELDDDVLEEADRCYNELRADKLEYDTPLGEMYGG